jgi:hypothetical protein
VARVVGETRKIRAIRRRASSSSVASLLARSSLGSVLELTFEASQSKSGFDERVREAVRDGVRERLREAVRDVVRERVPESNARGSGGLGGFLVGGITHLPLCDYRVVASRSHEGSQVGG